MNSVLENKSKVSELQSSMSDIFFRVVGPNINEQSEADLVIDVDDLIEFDNVRMVQGF